MPEGLEEGVPNTGMRKDVGRTRPGCHVESRDQLFTAGVKCLVGVHGGRWAGVRSSQERSSLEIELWEPPM